MVIRCNMVPGEPGHRPDCPWPHEGGNGRVMSWDDALDVAFVSGRELDARRTRLAERESALYGGRPEGLLTEAEHRVLDLTAELYNLLAREVVGKMPSRAGDLSEIATHLHAIQHAVLAQAAARAYPDRYRLLGETLRDRTVVEG